MSDKITDRVSVIILFTATCYSRISTLLISDIHILNTYYNAFVSLTRVVFLRLTRITHVNFESLLSRCHLLVVVSYIWGRKEKDVNGLLS